MIDHRTEFIGSVCELGNLGEFTFRKVSDGIIDFLNGSGKGKSHVNGNDSGYDYEYKCYKNTDHCGSSCYTDRSIHGLDGNYGPSFSKVIAFGGALSESYITEKAVLSFNLIFIYTLFGCIRHELGSGIILSLVIRLDLKS